MADTQAPGFTHSLPTRTITVTGEKTANMVRSTIRVSQIETRIIQMSMVGNTGVMSAVTRATEDFQRAYNAFEAALKAISNDLEVSRRPGARKRGGATQQRPNNAPQATTSQKAAKSETLKAKPAKPKPAAGQKTAPKKDAQAAPAEAQAPTQVAPQVAPQAEPAPAPAPAPAPESKAQAPVAHEEKVAAAEPSASVVPATLQSL